MALRHANSAMAAGVPFPVASTHGAVLAFRVAAGVAAAGAVLVALSPIAPVARDVPELSGQVVAEPASA
jgi:hypothetical protein